MIMSFEVKTWDGLAKLGKYTTRKRSFETPAFFPVIHPILQDIEPARIASEFGFSQIITSTYLLSKKHNLTNVPKIHTLLDLDITIMMDSGAYQLMRYGGVELSPSLTLEYQKKVETDIGTIMDHPISYDLNYTGAKERVFESLHQASEASEQLTDEVVWTLPIQGGRYNNLLRDYLDKVLASNFFEKYRYYALGSAVQVMIRQDYSTLVDMILTAKQKLPVTYPLHLFGAGHPAMFALATYLGCDSFDSAAYSLMAKDGRYMTTSGTYQLAKLTELPCICRICSSYTCLELQQASSDVKRKLLAEHNLWVSIEEIKRIKFSIKRGDLRDLVTTRMSSVPGLGKATRKAFSMIVNDKIKSKFFEGTPISKPYSTSIVVVEDLLKPEIIKAQKLIFKHIKHNPIQNGYFIFLEWYESSYRQIPDQVVRGLSKEQVNSLRIVSPLFGFLPLGFKDIFPFSQFTTELTLENYDLTILEAQIQLFKQYGLQKAVLFVKKSWDESIVRTLFSDIEIEYYSTKKALAKLLGYLKEV